MRTIYDSDTNPNLAILQNFFVFFVVGFLSLPCWAVEFRSLSDSALSERQLRSLEMFDLEIQQASARDEVARVASESYLDYRLNGIRGKESPQGPEHGRYCQNGFQRAGLPFCIGRFAKPSITCSHMIGYVGGGTAFCGERRTSQEGTFGMDYSGKWFSRKSWMKWSHGDRHQGGEGRYETEGPRLLPK